MNVLDGDVVGCFAPMLHPCFAAPAYIASNAAANFSLIAKPGPIFQLGQARGISSRLRQYAGTRISDPLLPACCQAWAYILQINSLDATHGLTLANN
jgi:hypothetical protein